MTVGSIARFSFLGQEAGCQGCVYVNNGFSCSGLFLILHEHHHGALSGTQTC